MRTSILQTVFAAVLTIVLIFTAISFLKREAVQEKSPDSYLLLATSTESESAITYKKTVAILFWIGEEANESNIYTEHKQSAWDSNWQESFGGIDDPVARCGFVPCGFEPKENPFYIALPYYELAGDGTQKDSAQLIPWYKTVQNRKSILKDHWVEIFTSEETVCYAQWEDVGPYGSDDFEYVFGTSSPNNSVNAKVGIAISPAVSLCLELSPEESLWWRFIDEGAVPEGPWRKRVTVS